jgi:hypothetical protein
MSGYMDRYKDARRRFMRWEIGDLFYAVPGLDVRKHEAELNDATEADVNAAVAAAVDRMEFLPTDLRGHIALRVPGGGGDGFTRLVSLEDVAGGLGTRADAAELRAKMADRLEEIARGLRAG